MILLENVYFDVWRPMYVPGGGTTAAQPYLTAIVGHLTRVKDSMLQVNGTVLYADYEIYVESTYDVRRGDIIKNILRKDNGLPYFEQTDSETWIVLQSTISEPGFMQFRDINIGRYVAGGPSQNI